MAGPVHPVHSFSGNCIHFRSRWIASTRSDQQHSRVRVALTVQVADIGNSPILPVESNLDQSNDWQSAEAKPPAMPLDAPSRGAQSGIEMELPVCSHDLTRGVCLELWRPLQLYPPHKLSCGQLLGASESQRVWDSLYSNSRQATLVQIFKSDFSANQRCGLASE